MLAEVGVVTDGNDDLEIYYHWHESVISWSKYNCVSERNQVPRVKAFLTSKALTFYTTEVQYKAKCMNLLKFLKELFECCFPSDWMLRE